MGENRNSYVCVLHTDIQKDNIKCIIINNKIIIIDVITSIKSMESMEYTCESVPLAYSISRYLTAFRVTYVTFCGIHRNIM